MTCEPFDVVVVPFPFTDRQAERRRPALVISSPDFNASHEQSILAMITSAGGEWPSDVALRDWREAGLSVPCKVRLKLFTLDDALILRKAGRLSARDAEAVTSGLARSLASSSLAPSSPAPSSLAPSSLAPSSLAMDTDAAPRALESLRA